MTTKIWVDLGTFGNIWVDLGISCHPYSCAFMTQNLV